MAKAVILPVFGFTQEDSQIVEWLVNEGDFVEAGDPLLEVTTDKVNMEVEAPISGVLAGIRATVGETVPVTTVLAYILAEGEILPEADATAVTTAKTAVAPPQITSPSLTPVAARMAKAHALDMTQLSGSGADGRITQQDIKQYLAQRSAQGSNNAAPKVRATPAARRLSRVLQLDLNSVVGSGPHGRVQAKDVQAIVETTVPTAVPTAVPPTTNNITRIPLTKMRRTIAQNMQRSVRDIPHISFQVDVDMTAVLNLAARANERLQEGEGKVSVTAVISKATAWTLAHHPYLNSSLETDEILLHGDIHMGIAVSLPEGLIVPVIHHANQKGIRQLADEIRQLSQRARSNKLRPNDMQGGTFTISNLGMFSIDRFTAIINPPQAAILAVGQTKRRFVPDAQGQPIVRPLCCLTLSADHRLVDGVAAAQFMTDLQETIEHPEIITL